MNTEIIYDYKNYDKIHVNKYGCAEGVAVECIDRRGWLMVQLRNGRSFLASYISIIKKITER